MDLSKLPRLSESPAPPDNAPTPAQSAAPPRTTFDRAPGIAPEVWISVIIGLIFLLLGWNFAKYTACVITGRPYHTNVNWVAGEKAGTEVAYPDLEGNVMWNDSAMFVFGLALMLEAVVLIAVGMNVRGAAALTACGLFIAALATVYNLIVAGIFFKAGALPLFSLLAVAFGGYIAFYEWNLLQSLRMTRRGLSTIV